MTLSDTQRIVVALEKRYAGGWAVLHEVADATGAAVRRWADLVAVSLWPSRGLEIHGVEIKADRRDWLRELENPAKAEPVFRYCDRWWVATLPGVVDPGELPPTWGLMILKKSRLHTTTAAPKLEPAPLDRKFLCAVLRRAAERQGRVVDEARALGRAEGQAMGERPEPPDPRSEAAQWKRGYDALEKQVRDFEKESGLEIANWRSGYVGEAVKGYLDRRHAFTNGARSELDHLELITTRLLDSIRQEREFFGGDG